MTTPHTGSQNELNVNTNDLRDYADEISNPYAQLILDAAHQLDVARTDRNILNGLVSELAERLKTTTALPELLEKVKRLEADLQVIAFGSRYVAEPDNSLTKSDWTRDQLIEYARAALNQEPGSFTDDPFNRAVLGLPLKETGQ